MKAYWEFEFLNMDTDLLFVQADDRWKAQLACSLVVDCWSLLKNHYQSLFVFPESLSHSVVWLCRDILSTIKYLFQASFRPPIRWNCSLSSKQLQTIWYHRSLKRTCFSSSLCQVQGSRTEFASSVSHFPSQGSRCTAFSFIRIV